MLKVLLNGTPSQSGLIHHCMEYIMQGKTNEICVGFQVNRDSDLESLQRDFFLANLLEIRTAIFVREKRYFLPHSFRELHQKSRYADHPIKAMTLAEWEAFNPEKEGAPVQKESDTSEITNELRAILILDHKESVVPNETLKIQFYDHCCFAEVKQIQKIFRTDLNGSDFGNGILNEREIGAVLLDVGEDMKIQYFNADPKRGFFRIHDSNTMVDGYGICIKK